MSCGGIVTETIILKDKVWINTVEKDHPNCYCAIYVEISPAARCVSPGDTVWWQSDNAYWTPKDRQGNTIERIDGKCNVANVILKRRGFSGVKRPTAELNKEQCYNFA